MNNYRENPQNKFFFFPPVNFDFFKCHLLEKENQATRLATQSINI